MNDNDYEDMHMCQEFKKLGSVHRLRLTEFCVNSNGICTGNSIKTVELVDVKTKKFTQRIGNWLEFQV